MIWGGKSGAFLSHKYGKWYSKHHSFRWLQRLFTRSSVFARVTFWDHKRWLFCRSFKYSFCFLRLSTFAILCHNLVINKVHLLGILSANIWCIKNRFLIHMSFAWLSKRRWGRHDLLILRTHDPGDVKFTVLHLMVLSFWKSILEDVYFALLFPTTQKYRVITETAYCVEFFATTQIRLCNFFIFYFFL